MVRILFLGNNWLGWKVLEWLCGQNDDVVGLVLHPPDKRKYGNEILQCAVVKAPTVLDGSLLSDREVVRTIRLLEPDIGVSVMFGYVLRSSLLDLFPLGCVNLHISYLPFNRGSFPNVWSIVDKTPAGVTMHYMNDGVDTGDIISQKKVLVKPVDTGETLYHKLERAGVDLFKKTWPSVRAGNASRFPQDGGAGTLHRVSDVERIDHIELDRTYTAQSLIDIIRARSFPPYSGAYFYDKQRKVFLRLDLSYENEPRSGKRRT